MTPDILGSPYGQLYFESLRRLMTDLPFMTLRVFMAIYSHCNEINTCNPGDYRLQWLAKCSQKTVKAAIEELEALDYIHVFRQQDPVLRRERRTFQVSPYIGAVSPDHEYEALKLWSSYENYVIDAVSNVRQEPPEESTEEPKNKNRQRNHHQHHQSTQTPEGGRSDAAREGANGGKRENGTNGKSPNGNGSSANGAAHGSAERAKQANAEDPIPPFPPSPQPVLDTGALTPYRAALKLDTDESAAERLYTAVQGLQLAKARQLVDCYGVESVMLAVEHLRQQQNLKNPAGWLINKLREGALVPEDAVKLAPERRDGSYYLNGEYAEFYDH